MARSPSKSIEFRGQPVQVCYRGNLRDTSGNPAHAATFIRQRLIVLDEELAHALDEHARILVHELFHFVWVRLGNGVRRNWEDILTAERHAAARGESGWSAEWRKGALRPGDAESRSRRWREYCCESFCDTAAIIHAGNSAECTLAERWLARRREWFSRNLPGTPYI